MYNNKKVSAVILAAGSSTRFGGHDKLMADIAGKRVLHRAVDVFLSMPEVDELIIVTQSARVDYIRQMFMHNGKISVTEGGSCRNLSALNGVMASSGELLLIHDGARPFIDADVVKSCLNALTTNTAVAAAAHAIDTIKLTDENGIVTTTTQRSNTWLTLSPQCFHREVYLSAYGDVDYTLPEFTDCCSVLEKYGERIQLVECPRTNIKITTQDDLILAEAIANTIKPTVQPRVCVGIGQDSHRIGTTGTMMLGGIEILDMPALSANSDGDVVLHAITNAVSGITGINILGKIADEICRSGEKNSAVYLAEALRFLEGRLTHISITIECLKPHLAKHIPSMKESIAELLGIQPRNVGITATSGEGLTDFGRGDGISVFCIATALVYN